MLNRLEFYKRSINDDKSCHQKFLLVQIFYLDLLMILAEEGNKFTKDYLDMGRIKCLIVVWQS